MYVSVLSSTRFRVFVLETDSRFMLCFKSGLRYTALQFSIAARLGSARGHLRKEIAATTTVARLYLHACF
jgi:hypothetical protein